MQEYTIKITKPIFRFFRIIISLLIMVIMMSFLQFFNLQDVNEIVILLPFLLVFFIILIITRKWLIVNCRIVLDENIIKVNYFMMYEKVFKCDISDIEFYSYSLDRFYNIFKIKLRDKRQLTLFVDNDDSTSINEFFRFYSKFESIVVKKNILSNDKIIKEADFFSTKLAFFLAFFLAVVMVLVPILIVIFNNKFNFGGMIIFYSSGLYYIYRIYIERKK